MKQIKSGMILLLIAIIMFVYINFFEKDMQSTDEIKSQKEKVVPNFNEIDYDTFVITADDKTIKFVRQKNKWMMTLPMVDFTDFNNVSGIITQLNDLKYKRKFENVSDQQRQDMGINNPKIQLKFFNKNDNKDVIIDIGNRNVTKENYYITVNSKDNEKVYSIGNEFVSTIKLDAGYYRDKKLIDIFSYSVKQLEVDKYTFKKENDMWYITNPYKSYCQKEKINDFVSTINSSRIKDFVPINEIKPEKVIHSIKIINEKDTETAHILRVYENEYNGSKIIYYNIRDIYFTLEDKSLINEMDIDIKDYLPDQLAYKKLESVDTFIIEYKGNKSIFYKIENKWLDTLSDSITKYIILLDEIKLDKYVTQITEKEFVKIDFTFIREFDYKIESELMYHINQKKVYYHFLKSGIYYEISKEDFNKILDYIKKLNRLYKMYVDKLKN